MTRRAMDRLGLVVIVEEKFPRAHRRLVGCGPDGCEKFRSPSFSRIHRVCGPGFVRGENLAQAHEGTHDGDVDLDGPLAIQDAGKQAHSLLGEGVGQVAPAAARFL